MDRNDINAQRSREIAETTLRRRRLHERDKEIDELRAALGRKKIRVEELTRRVETLKGERDAAVKAMEADPLHAIAEAVRAMVGLEMPEAEEVRELAMQCRRLRDKLRDAETGEKEASEMADRTEEPDGYTDSLCPECGRGVGVDEDGLCVSCGNTAVGSGAEKIFAEITDLKSALEAEGCDRVFLAELAGFVATLDCRCASQVGMVCSVCRAKEYIDALSRKGT